MAEQTLVTAADIARMAGVGRSAVSNWRRRYAGFPQPVAGTSASPLFTLTEVESWLRDQGKLLEVPLAERAWQELRVHAGDDIRVASALADAGENLVAGLTAEPSAVAELAREIGPADTFEVLFNRFHETRTRGAAGPTTEIARFMAALAEGAAVVLDPACGTGELLLAAQDDGARQLLGQDASADLARLAGIRLRFGPGDRSGANEPGETDEVVVRTENALLRDAFPGVAADAVLCCPPSYPRAENQDLDTADPRWVYGVPPRMEPELAWVQHVLSHVTPAGLAGVLMPQVAAARRSGRRIRAQLLRKGALRAVIALPAASQASQAGQLWLLRQPSGEIPATVLMMVAPDPAAAIATWRRFTDDPGLEEPGVSRAVPVIDLLDDAVDLNPARYLSAPPAEESAEHFAEAREDLTTVLNELPRLIPDMRPADQPRPLDFVTLAELARTGRVEVYQAPTRADPGDESAPLLTAEDMIEDRRPSGRGQAGERWITLRTGDVVVATSGTDHLIAQVVTAPGALLGPGLTLVRTDPEWLDAHFVAGALRSSANGQVAAPQTGSNGKTDIARALIARLPLTEQRAYGDAFRRADKLQSAARAAAEIGANLAQSLADGIAGGTLEPPAGPTNSPLFSKIGRSR